MQAEPQLLANRIITPDGTMLQSMNRHDFACHTDAITGEVYFTDGGLTCIRRSVNIAPAIPADVWADDPHEEIREAMHWGSYGKHGDQDLHYIAVKDLTDDHLAAILRTQLQVPTHVYVALVNEKDYRKVNNIFIKE